MTETLDDNSAIERQPVIEGKRMNIILMPSTKSKAKEAIKETQDAKAKNT
jgi:hypothetical protein